MHHMSGAWHSVQRTVRNVRVKARRLLINVDQSIFLAGNDDDGHFQVGDADAQCYCNRGIVDATETTRSLPFR